MTMPDEIFALVSIGPTRHADGTEHPKSRAGLWVEEVNLRLVPQTCYTRTDIVEKLRTEMHFRNKDAIESSINEVRAVQEAKALREALERARQALIISKESMLNSGWGHIEIGTDYQEDALMKCIEALTAATKALGGGDE